MRSRNTAAHDLCTVITDKGWLQEASLFSTGGVDSDGQKVTSSDWYVNALGTDTSNGILHAR